MKTIIRARHVSSSVLALTLGGGLAGGGCTTTAVTPDAGGSGSSSGSSSSSSSGAGSSSSGGSSSSSGASGSSSGGIDAGGCFGTAGTCTPVAPPPSGDGAAPATTQTITDFESWMPVTADGGAADPTQFTYYVNAMPPAANAVLGALLYINDGDGTPALTMVPGYMSNYAVHIGTTTTPGLMDASADYGGFLMLYFPAATAGCLEPAMYHGIRFWIRGASGAGTMGLGLSTVDTVAATDGGLGICNPGSDAASCADAVYKFNIPANWTQISVPWNQFTPGMTSSGCASPPGSGIIRIIFQPYESYPGPLYKIAPAPYSLDIDNIEFY